MLAATLDGMLRSLVIGQLGHYDDMDTIKEAQKRFADYCSNGGSLPADLKAAVFSTCLANGDNSTFDQLLKVGCLSVSDTISCHHISFCFSLTHSCDTVAS